MDNTTLMRVLSQIPEARLRLLELAGELTGRAWEMEDKRRREVEEAITEASNHITATRRLHRTMRNIVIRPGD